jgi:hypothetical protein
MTHSIDTLSVVGNVQRPLLVPFGRMGFEPTNL